MNERHYQYPGYEPEEETTEMGYTYTWVDETGTLNEAGHLYPSRGDAIEAASFRYRLRDAGVEIWKAARTKSHGRERTKLVEKIKQY